MPIKKQYYTRDPDDYFMLVSLLNESEQTIKVSEEEGIYEEDSKTRYHFNDSTIELIGEAWHPLSQTTTSSIFADCIVSIYAGDLTQVEDTKSKLEKIIGVTLNN